MAIKQRAMKSKQKRRGVLSGSTLGKAATAVFLFGTASAAFAHGGSTGAPAQAALSAWTFGKAFTFLFVTLGPLNVIGPFAAMTDGCGTAFKRRLAFQASVIATVALLVAATVGAATLKAWSISVGALLLTAGAILFLVALLTVLAGYAPQAVRESEAARVPPSATSELAFSPLAFPTIVTPYGLALLILLFTLYPVGSGGLWILATAALVLALNLLVMLCVDLIAKIPLIKPSLNILGCVMSVLLVALGVQTVADGLRLIAEQRF